MERKKTFGAESKSVSEVLKRSSGFYIPPYQRQYNWDEGHIRRLFEDINHGLVQILVKQKKDSITFIGTLIVIDDLRSETIAPNISRSDMPDTILPVIDGQQRLTTIALMNICLHDEIKIRSAKLEDSSGTAYEWLSARIIEVLPKLQETFEEDKVSPEDSIYRWQPRIIRAYQDSWGRSRNEAKYESPIAGFIHGYSKHIRNEDDISKGKPYTAEGYIKKSDVLWKNYIKIQNQIEIQNEIKDDPNGKKTDDPNGEEANVEKLSLKQVAVDLEFQQAILKQRFPEDVCEILSNEGNDDFKKLLRLVFFANFLLNRVWVTVVYAPGAYAFEMFESLNTTGEPLTIFETFRPKVIESETLSEYEDSKSREYMKPIEEYFDQFDDADERQRETAKLLIPFALAESGKKLPSDVKDQRQYMRHQYDILPDIKEKRKFVQHLSHVAGFMSQAWKQEGRPFSDIPEFADREDVLMCMDVLKRADHHITIGPLARYYSQILLAQSDLRDTVVNELAESIKAMTAFFALWRGAGKTTGTLAAQYRELMEKGFYEVGIQPFCRYTRVGRRSEILTAEELRKALRHALGKGRTLAITSKKDWVKLSAERPVYDISQPLTRFLLFASAHDTVKDDHDSELPDAGVPGTLDMLTWNKWSDDLTIEHVAPQEPDPEQDDWPKPLYENPVILNYLGNLTLLPTAVNSSFNNKPWEKKKKMYHVLSGLTLEEREARLADARNEGVELPESTKDILRAGKYFPHLSTICNVEKWNEELVRKRSKRLAKLVWKNIAPWLGFDDE